MNNNAKNIEKKQSSKNPCYRSARTKQEQLLVQEEELLNQEKKKIGYDALPWDEFVAISVDNLGQAEASQVLILQDAYRALKNQKNTLERTIYLEPSKIHEIVDDASKLLLNNADPIYQQSGQLVRIISNKSKNQKASNLLIDPVDQAFLTIYLTKHGSFMKLDGPSGRVNKVDAPERLARYLLAKKEWDVPILTA